MLHSPKLLLGFTITSPFSETNAIGQLIYRKILCTKASASGLRKCWYIMNIVLAIFFGFIHQGGVIQLTQYLSKNVLTSRPDMNANVYLVTSHLYNIPTSYLFLPSTKTLLTNLETGQKYTRKKHFYLNEYGSLPIDELQRKIKLILDVNEMRLQHDKKNYKLYLAIPSSLTEELSIALFESNHTMLKYQRVKTFYPHLSIEAFPNFFIRYLTEIRTDELNLEQKLEFYNNQEEYEPFSLSSVFRQFTAVLQQFGLVLYRVEVRRQNTFSE